MGIVAMLDSTLFDTNLNGQTESKAELLATIAAELGWVPSESRSLTELSELILTSLIASHQVPSDTPLEWVDRMTNEVFCSGQRLKSHCASRVNLNLIFFFAELEDSDEDDRYQELQSKRLEWKNLCQRVEYIPIRSKHYRMLESATAKVIAGKLNDLMKN